MKLYAIIILYKDQETSKTRQLKSALELSSFGLFSRKPVGEGMQFAARLLAERSATPSRNTLTENEYRFHCFIRPDNLVGCCVTDEHYQQRVAFTLLNKLLTEFADRVPQMMWSSVPEDKADFDLIYEYLTRWQNPSQADALTRVQDEVEATKEVLQNTMQSVLERGEKLDDLVDKSEILSAQSKMFYTQARKMNKCCNYV